MEIIKIRVELNGEVPAKKELQEIDKLIDRLNKKTVSPKAPNQTAQDVVNLNKNMSRLNELTGQATKQTGLWGNALSMIKFTAIAAGIAAVTGSLKSALTKMKAVDTQLTNIQKVSNMTAAELDKIGDKAYATASKYGVAANEYLSAVYTFQKAGLGDAADQLGELTTKTMLVGDTSAEVASKFLIAVNAAWEMGGSMKKLSTVVDEADYINNNYATSLDKLAAAMPIVASTSANLGMSIEETLAVIGTITSKTQETGTKAATAWRALAMNITGELGSIVDETGETIEVTEESVKSISDALKIYGNDAVKAAQQTGQIIDPMQGVISLAEAYKDGLLTDIELEKILMNVGGKLRTNQLTALVKDLASETSTYYDIMSKLPDAAGTADSEINIMLSSWESKTNILKNTWTEFVQKSIQTDTVKGILDVATALLDFGDNLGLVVAEITGATVAIKTLTAAHKANKAATEAAAIASEIQAMAERGAATEVEALTAAEKANELQTKATKAAHMAWLGYIGIGVTAVIMLYQALKQLDDEQLRSAQESYDSSMKALETDTERLNKLTELSAKYEELSKNGGSLSEIQSVQDEINSVLGDQYEAVDLVNGAYETQKGILNGIVENLRDATEEERNRALAQSVRVLEEMSDNVFGQGRTFRPGGYFASQAEQEDYAAMTSGLSHLGYATVMPTEISEIVAWYDELTEAIKRYEEAYSGDAVGLGRNDAYNDLLKWQSEFGTAVENYKSLLEAGNEKGAEEVAASIETIAEAAQDAAGGIENVTEAMQRLKDVASEDTGFQSMSDAVAKFRDMIDAGEVNSRAFWNTAEFLFGPEVLDEYYGNAQGLIALFENSNLEEVFDGESLDGFIESLREVDDSIAQVSETADGTTSFVINDVDALAEAWGMTKTQVLALIEAAEAFGELDFTGNGLIDYLDYLGVDIENGVVNLASMQATLEALGYQEEYIAGVTEQLEAMGAVDMSDTQSEADAAATATEGVAGAADEAKGALDNVNGATMQNVIGEMGGLQGAINTANNKAIGFKNTLMSIDGTGITTTFTTNHVLTYTTVGKPFAKGTRNAPGGAALVGDEYSPSGKPKPELIVDNGVAYLAGMRGPEIVRLSPGAQVYPYSQTREMMRGTAFTTAMPALAAGVTSSVSGGGSGSTITVKYNSNGGSGGPSSTIHQKGKPGILSSARPSRSGYTFLGWARTASATSAVWQPGGTITAYSNQTLYAVWKKNTSSASGSAKTTTKTTSTSSSGSSVSYGSSGGSGSGGSTSSKSSSSSSSSTSTDKRQKLLDEANSKIDDNDYYIWLGQKTGTIDKKEELEVYKSTQETIREYTAKLYALGEGTNSKYVKELTKKWYEYADKIEELQDDLMSELKDSLNEQLSDAQKVNALEEKRLALIEAQEAITNAQNERTVRIYNAATGQWEWVADAKAVKAAQDSYESAKKALAEQEIRSAIDAIANAGETPNRTISEIIADINAVGTEQQKSAAAGATSASEAIRSLGADATNDMLLIPGSDQVSNAAKLSKVISIRSALLSGSNVNMAQNASAMTQNAGNGNQYYINGVEISEERASSMTVKQLAESLSALCVYNNS